MTRLELALIILSATLAASLSVAAWWAVRTLTTLVELITAMLDLITRSGATWTS